MEVNFREWIVSDSGKHPQDNFPELQLNKVALDHNSVGLALSGGGSRAHTLCTGYLRGLRDLGYLEQVKYISCVSGGAWASSIYTFVEDEISLLGESTKPRNLNLNLLKEASPGHLAEVLTEFQGLKSVLCKRFNGVPTDDIWQDMIGEHILQKFGLHGKVMAIDEAQRDQILQRNEHISYQDIIVPPKGKPFLIINATLGGPKKYTIGRGNSLQMTPLYTGTPFYRNDEPMQYFKIKVFDKMSQRYSQLTKKQTAAVLLNLHRKKEENHTPPDEELFVGGGFIESFAFGSTRTQSGKGILRKHFTLDDGIGASSAAFAAVLQKKSRFTDYTPKVNYFPLEKGAEHIYNKTMTLFDGGMIENTGIIALLQRGVKKIICFINTATPLNRDFVFQPNLFNNEALQPKQDKDLKYCADTQLLCLFGAVTRKSDAYDYTSNQVFETFELNEVIETLLNNKESGRGAICRKILTTVDNRHWHIRAGQKFEVLFVYNEECKNFEAMLPEDTLSAIQEHKSCCNPLFNRNRKSFGNYPFYNTLFQNTRGLELDREELNLLAAQAEFIVKHNSGEIKKLF